MNKASISDLYLPLSRPVSFREVENFCPHGTLTKKHENPPQYINIIIMRQLKLLYAIFLYVIIIIIIINNSFFFFFLVVFFR